MSLHLLGPTLTTKSGNLVKLGTGTGTKWQHIKKGRGEAEKGTILHELVDYLALSIKHGFRHIDTAEIYTTHPEVAQAIAKCGVPREDLFITTKYNPGIKNQKAFHKSARDGIDAALAELGLKYLDLYLIHFPFFTEESSHGQTLETLWKDIVQAKKDGKVRYIGVSNFSMEHIEKIKAAAGSKEFYPQVNQIEFHPYLQNQSKGIYQYCKENDILIEAYGPLSPLFRMTKDGKDIENHPLKAVIPELAKKYDKTDAQILLRYTLQKGILPVTTSSQPQRQREALAVYDFSLDDSDVKLIDDKGASFYFRGFFEGLFLLE